MSAMIEDTTFPTDDAVELETLRPVRRTTDAVDSDGVQGLEAFVVEHYDRLLRLARLICHDAADTTDAVQSALEHAWRHRGDLRDLNRQRPWLDRIVVREAIRVSRRRRTWLERILGLDHETDGGPEGLDPIPGVGLRMALHDAFSSLSPEQRAVVALHLHAGYTVAETATIVDAPVETVRSRLRVARERLRAALGEAAP